VNLKALSDQRQWFVSNIYLKVRRKELVQMCFVTYSREKNQCAPFQVFVQIGLTFNENGSISLKIGVIFNENISISFKITYIMYSFYFWQQSLNCGVVQSVPSTAAISDLLCVTIWVLIPLIHPLVLSGCSRNIQQWSKEVARNVLEFYRHSISMLRKDLLHAVKT
jgi:hypothetical protein